MSISGIDVEVVNSAKLLFDLLFNPIWGVIGFVILHFISK